jgi:hypothetical protein
LSSHFSDTVGNLLTGIEDLQVLVGRGGHADSIARMRGGGRGDFVQIHLRCRRSRCAAFRIPWGPARLL